MASCVGRADVLATLLALAAVRASSLRVAARWATLAMLCKETGFAAFPIVALLRVPLSSARTIQRGRPMAQDGSGEAWSLYRRALSSCTAWCGFVSWAIVLAVARLALNRGPPFFVRENNPGAFAESRWVRFWTLLDYFGRHVELLVNPAATLCCDRSHSALPLVVSLAGAARTALRLIPLGVCVGIAWTVARGSQARQERARVAVVFLLVPMGLLSNVPFTLGFTVAERVLYFPSVGVALLLGLLAEARRCAARVVEEDTLLGVACLRYPRTVLLWWDYSIYK